jgi:energy-converting hydrogenase Eha subunit A
LSGVHRPLRKTILVVVVILAATAFYNAVVGVFGLPLAILSMCCGVVFAVFSVIATSKREEQEGQR